MYLRFRLELLINLSMISLPKNLLFFLLLFTACQPPKSNTVEEIIKQSNAVYGFDNQAYQIDFDFRDYHYSLERSQGFYSYSRQTFKEEKKIIDLMTTVDKLKRFENDSLIVLQDSIRKLYSNSLNSVMYFFQLPRPLQDPAVNVELLNSVVIEGNPYWTLKITFDQEGGGEDFQDEFRYWISKKNYQIDFLAYNYLTDGGGTRFRKAKNKRMLEGFLFQDYVNYKPDSKFTPLDSLPLFFEQGKLKELSQIENKKIKVKHP